VRGLLIERVTGLPSSVTDEIERLDNQHERDDEIDADPAQ
jgi:hypothetical protein